MNLSPDQTLKINRKIRKNRLTSIITIIIILHLFMASALAPILIFLDHKTSLPLALIIYTLFIIWIISRSRNIHIPDVSMLNLLTLEASFTFTVRTFHRHSEKNYIFGTYKIDSANNPDHWFNSKQPLKLNTPYRVQAICISEAGAPPSYYLIEETFEELPAA